MVDLEGVPGLDPFFDIFCYFRAFGKNGQVKDRNLLHLKYLNPHPKSEIKRIANEKGVINPNNPVVIHVCHSL